MAHCRAVIWTGFIFLLVQSVTTDTREFFTRFFLPISDNSYFIPLFIYVVVCSVCLSCISRNKPPRLRKFIFLHNFGALLFMVSVLIRSRLEVSGTLYFLHLYFYFMGISKYQLNGNPEQQDLSTELLYATFLGMGSIMALGNYGGSEIFLFCWILRMVISLILTYKIFDLFPRSLLILAQFVWLFSDCLNLMDYYEIITLRQNVLLFIWSFAFFLGFLGLNRLKNKLPHYEKGPNMKYMNIGKYNIPTSLNIGHSE